jgi:hypothetical protein
VRNDTRPDDLTGETRAIHPVGGALQGSCHGDDEEKRDRTHTKRFVEGAMQGPARDFKVDGQFGNVHRPPAPGIQIFFRQFHGFDG